MTLAKIQKLVKSIQDNEQIATPVLAVKLAKYVEKYPYDQTIGMMSRVIDQMSMNNNVFINRATLRGLYNKYYSNNTKFAELFEEEMGTINNEEPSVAVMPRDEATDINMYQGADPILANALNSVFDKSIPVKMYSQALADQAKKTANSTLDAWNLKPTALDIVDGNDKFLVIKADYETPKGITSFYVPVEINKNETIASIFMGNTGPQELNHSNIKKYLTTYAGTKLKITASGILQVLVEASAENREISDAELALTRLHATRQGKSDFFANGIVGQKISEASVQDVELPKYDDCFSFEKQFTSEYGKASFQFGDKVKIGREHIVRELNGFGHKNPQIAITKTDSDTIFYGVSLDAGKVAFTVPVKISNNKINKPNIILCNGSVSSFDQDGINELYVNNYTDYKVAAVASPSYGLKPSDLISQIKKALNEGNHSKAEDALNVLSNSGDEKAYAIGFKTLMQGLGNVKVAETQCSMMIKNSSSEHPICGHTGLPIHKTYQDKDGNCRPLYRKGMAETYEGASFLNAKIFG